MTNVTYGNAKLSRADYIKALVDEQILPAATDEMHEQAVDMLNLNPAVSDSTDAGIDKFINSVEGDLVDELIRQLREYKKSSL